MKLTNPLKFIRPMMALAPALLIAITAFALPPRRQKNLSPLG